METAIQLKTKATLRQKVRSTTKLQKIINHEQKIRNIANNIQSNSKFSQYTNKSLSKQSKLNPITIKSTQKIILTKRISNHLLQAQQKRRSITKLNTQQTQFPSQQGPILPDIIQNPIKQEKQSQKQLRIYLRNLLPKNYEQNCHIIEQINSNNTKIKSIWWNLHITILSNLAQQIDSLNYSILKQLIIAYLHLQQEIMQNQKGILSLFDDTNFIVLVCQSFYFQKLLIFIGLTNIDSPPLNKNIQVWMKQSIKGLISIKKYLCEILLQMQSYSLKFHRLKKPSYLIRQKKLLQINKIISQIKQSFYRIRKQIYPIKILSIDQKLPQNYLEMVNKYNQMKYQILDLPKIPYIQDISKQYLIIINPEYVFYQEDKKNTCIIIKDNTIKYLQQLSKYAILVLFFHKKIKNIHPFLKQINTQIITLILDRTYYSYKQTKQVIDLNKFGYPLQKIIIIDFQKDKYYGLASNHIHIQKQYKSVDIILIFEKLLQIFKKQLSPDTLNNISKKQQ